MKLKYKIYRYLAVFLALNLLFEVISPSVAMALTYGPYQPEYMSFEPASSTDMVDAFTGDFKYNLPLLDVDGYPVNLSYHAGATMDEEAGWVGLGWSLNAGSMNRSIRGIPDDFDGEGMQTITHLRDQKVWGVGGEMTVNSNGSISYSSVSVGHGTGLARGLSIVHNNYKGYGIEVFRDDAHSLSLSASDDEHGSSGSVGGSLGASISSLDGGSYSYSSSKGLSNSTYQAMGNATLNSTYSQNVGVGTNINTRTGEAYRTYNGSTTRGISVSCSYDVGYGTDYSTGGTAGISWGKGNSHTVPISSQSYNLSSANNYVTHSSSFSMKAGSYSCAGISYGAWGYSHELGIYSGLNAFENTTSITDPNRTRPLYGYFNLEHANENSLLDFNRSNESPLRRESPALPLAYHTYDIFNASAQGLYSGFRPHRSDVGLVYDNTSYMTGGSSGTSLEMGVSLFMHLGLNKYSSTVHGRNGKPAPYAIDNTHGYYAPDITNPSTKQYEKYYFKNYGEYTASDDVFEAKINNTSVVSPNVYKTSLVSFGFSSPLAANASTVSGAQKAIYRTRRDYRNTNYFVLDAKQASKYGMHKLLRNYPANALTLDGTNKEVSGYTTSSRLSYGRDNHMSQIMVTSPDGSRYFYADPQYNLTKKSTVFNASEKNYSGFVGGLSFNGDESAVRYDATSFSAANGRGMDNLFRQETTPGYAQSLLLSDIVSSDYVDLTGDGPSYDDLGDYTKFNYSTLTDVYGWRTPYNGIRNVKEAVLDKGLIADEYDDKGVVEYGQKELKYLHSIETKNYVAVFKTSPRKDALGVVDINGTAPTQFGTDHRMYKLDRIELYAKNELIRATATGTAAIPIKTVNFEYDYSLCSGVPNNVEVMYTTASADKGKLTLKRIWYTYGASDKGSLSAYQFFYGDWDHDKITDFNPNYDQKAVDKWGNYKPNSGSSTGTGGVLNNDEFPYAGGNKIDADHYSTAWNLSTILSPTGSETDVDYESDDYGYVQDEPVGQMLKIADVRSGSFIDPFLPPALANSITFQDQLIVDLKDLGESGIKVSDPINFNKLFNNKEDLYFKCFTKLNKHTEPGLPQYFWDYVPGYAKIKVGQCSIYGTETYPVGSDSYHRYVLIPLQMVGAQDDNTGIKINPITKAGWQFTRKYLPRVAYPGSEPATSSPGNPLLMLVHIITGLGTSITDMVAAAANKPNIRFLGHQYCDQIDCHKSFVRLYNPGKKRLGGGHRVKQILISDEWGSMAADGSNPDNTEKTSVYGQQYTYTTKDASDGRTISSGVAQYEPMAGGDEISLRKPRAFNVGNQLAPNDNYFQEEPFGESLYPSPLVGYSEVTIKSVGKLKASEALGCGIGKTVYKFYTAKDFPVRVTQSGKTQIPIETDPIDGFTIIASMARIYGATQGYVVELNDMHGKPRSMEAYAEGAGPGAAPVSSIVYSYKQNSSGSLNNKVPTVDENNMIQDAVIGRSIDLTTDIRTSNSVNASSGQYKGVDFSPCTLGFPSFSTNITGGCQYLGYTCATMTKVVQTHGILYKTESHINNLQASTENMLWDGKTGDVVLTKTVNNFNAPVYSFKYPAHWMYEGMSGQYKREGFTWKILAGNTTQYDYATGIINMTSASPFLEAGDEVVFYDSNYSLVLRAWVYHYPGLNQYYFIDEAGNVLRTPTYSSIDPAKDYYVKVVRTNQSNQLNQAAGNVLTLTNPAATSTPDLSSNILEADATEWCRNWNIYIDTKYSQSTGIKDNCNLSYIGNGTSLTKTINPFTSGFSSKWGALKAYGYRTARVYAGQNDISTDGTYQNYAPYWTYGSGWGINDTDPYFMNWIAIGNTTMISPHGNHMESQNTIGLYNTRDFSFNHTLLNTETSNSKYNQMGYESFEPYLLTQGFLTPCGIQGNDHMDFGKNMTYSYNPLSVKPYLDFTTAHTGRVSLCFRNGKTVTLNHFGANDEAMDKPFYDGLKQVLEYRCDGVYDGYNNYSGNSVQIGKLHLDNGKYVMSFWVKGPATLTDFSSLYNLAVLVAAVPQTPLSVSKTGIINGWQKFDYTYDISALPYATINISFTGTLPAGVTSINLDDVRIHPYNASMTSYAYDPTSLRLCASLDDRNFASIVEYDNEGKVVRTKTEKDKGIYTTMENRQSLIKK
ncbi:MAG: hypothetical protein K0S33_792 [Bacteroidetes bacterium]|jgi:hypothetical protein|nr:hypothetical protein [Bacteroidota bacterium]